MPKTPQKSVSGPAKPFLVAVGVSVEIAQRNNIQTTYIKVILCF